MPLEMIIRTNLYSVEMRSRSVNFYLSVEFYEQYIKLFEWSLKRAYKAKKLMLIAKSGHSRLRELSIRGGSVKVKTGFHSGSRNWSWWPTRAVATTASTVGICLIPL